MSHDKVVPTVGRRIWYWPSREDLAGMSPMEFIEPEGKRVFPREAQPLDAGILYVHDDGTVNLDVTDHLGRHWFREAVTITVSTGPLLDFKGSSTGNGVAQWMPYQTTQRKKEVRRAPRTGDQLYYWPVPGMEALIWKDETQPCVATVVYVGPDGITANVMDQGGGWWLRKGWALPEGEHRYAGRKVGQFQWPQDFDQPAKSLHPSPQGAAMVLTTALAANGLCRSAYAIAERMCRLHGPNAYGTNWAGFHNVLKDGLEAQHKVLKPYLAAEADRGNAEPFEDRLKRVTKDIGEVGDEHLPYPLADAGAEAEQADSWRETYAYLLAHAMPFMMQPPVPKTGLHQVRGALHELIKYARIGTALTTHSDMAPAKTGSMHEAVRRALHHHKLATKADGVIESDLIAAVLDNLPAVPAAEADTSTHETALSETDYRATLGGKPAVADGINLFYTGEFDNETPEGAAERRYAATRLWGKGWQTGWAEGWQRGYGEGWVTPRDSKDNVMVPDAPTAPEHKA